MSRLRPLLWPAVFTVAAGALLVSLGLWQLHRLAWKEGILAQIDSRTKAPPQRLPPRDSWASLVPRDYEYRRVILDGTFDNSKEVLVFRGTEAGPGYFVLTPLKLDAGGSVIVNRGFVPDDLKDASRRTVGQPSGHVEMIGLMRAPEARNLFTPADVPARGQFFTRDPLLIAAQDGLTDAAPFTVDADSTPNPGGWPRGGATVVDIPNNHFSYAMTWFGLAMGLVGVFVNFAWKRLADHPTTPVRGREDDRATHEAHHLS